MEPLVLHEFHHALNAQFTEVRGLQVVGSYGDPLAEHAALRESAGVLDFSFRSRLCLTGADRVRFLHGQVTNDIGSVPAGEGCYAALVTAKGKMQSDLNVYCLANELLLDFEPALTGTVSQRLEKYIVADDVQIVDVGPLYGLLSVQGPKSAAMMVALEAVQRAEKSGTVSRDTVLAELGKTDQSSSVLGIPIKLNAKGDIENASFFLFQVKDGKFVLVTQSK